MRLTLIVLAISAMVLSGCGKEEDGMEQQDRAEARAVEMRTYVDDLAAKVGTNPEVAQDEMADCVPGQEDSGTEPLYTLRVAVDDDAADRLRGEIADELARDDWEVKVDSVDPENQVISVRFAKGDLTMGVKVSATSGRATVGGSGGCVR